MATYISLLKGINVSGHKPLKMVHLRDMYNGLGFNDVVTYVQSGNVIFSTSEQDTNLLEQKIAQRIKTDFKYDVSVIVLTEKKLSEIIEANPFLKHEDKEPAYFHVTFLAAKPDLSLREEIEAKKQVGEEIVFAGDVIYLYCPNGYGRTKLNNSFLEKKLKVEATTRNWKTTNKLLQLARQT